VTAARVHPLAHVDPSAELGEGTSVGPFAVIGPGVKLGRDCEVRSHAVIEGPGTRLGDRNVVHEGAVLGGPPQDKKYKGEHVELVIGDDNTIREHVTAHRGTPGGGGLTTIGDRNLLLASCHIAHDCVVGSDVILSNNVLLAGHVLVEDRAIMNGSAAIHHFGTVGTSSYVGGLTRLVRDAPPYMVTEGHPARVVKVNAVGLLRAGVPQERVDLLRAAFRHLFRQRHATLTEAFAAIDGEGLRSPEVNRLCDFLVAQGQGKNGRAREAQRH
jgi:UDP-N-acetylglucosamine acyltransferase